ncbi:adenosine-specific kinase [Patescibacteria group bacterium]
MDFKSEIVKVKNPDNKNLIFGQSHFIKTVEDIHEALVAAVSGIKFGVAFCEASGERLVRTSGTDKKMLKLATQNALKVGCGHSFFVFLDNAFPINVLNTIKNIQEVANIFCATANDVSVIVAQTSQGRGVMGIIDGGSPTRVEGQKDVQKRKKFIREIGYKL